MKLLTNKGPLCGLILALVAALAAPGALAQETRSNVGGTSTLKNWKEDSSGNLVPVQDNTYSIGTTAKSIADIKIDGTATIATAAITTLSGTPALTGSVSIGDAAADILTITGSATLTLAPAAATGGTGLAITSTVPIETTGTNAHAGESITQTIGAATGGTNTTSAVSVTQTGGANTTGGTNTNAGVNIVQTTGAWAAGSTNTMYGVNVAPVISNATGGTNAYTAVNLANITGDAQITESAIVVGTGYDAGLTVGSAASFSAAVTMTADVLGDGTDQMMGFFDTVTAATAVTITVAQAGSTFVSSGAVVIQLPEASTAIGAEYTFVVGNASNFDVNPQDSPDIILPFDDSDGGALISPSAGDMVRCAVVGGSITVRAISADQWAVVARNQDWADAN